MKTKIDYVYKYRWLIAGVIFVLCVIFEINGSSIGEWNRLLGIADNDLLLGTSRAIRIDEWGLSTPLALSQYFDSQGAFSYFSNVVRGASTDVFLEYGQPVRDIAVIFRPFHWGYLFLSPGRGLAFYWSGRCIALFMVSLEMAMLLTKKRRALSLLFAVMVTWAPLVQWWFAINGLVEMLIYIQLSVLLVNRFFSTGKFYVRTLCTVGAAICAGGYILTLYPGWMIPLAYLLLGLLIWAFWERDRTYGIRKKDVAMMAVVGIVFAALMSHIMYKSWDTVISIANTSYPGGRSETGGGYSLNLFNYVSNIWYVMKGGLMGTGGIDVSSSSQFIDFFPLCYILPAIVLFRDKIKDRLLVILTIVSVFLEAYAVIGYPEVISKITLLSVCTSMRVSQIAGFVNLLLVFRVISLMKKPVAKWLSGICALLIAGVVLFVAWTIDPAYYSMAMLIATVAIFAVLFYLLFRQPIKYAVGGLALVCSVVMLASGFLVNPIRRGCTSVYESSVLADIQEVHEEDTEALWIVEGLSYPMTNLPILVGAPTINSTNVYPLLERWSLLDPEGKYFDAYNRYAHISVNLKEEGEAEFYSYEWAPDCFTVDMTLEDMKMIGAEYIFTGNDLMEKYGEYLELVCETGTYKIYRIK